MVDGTLTCRLIYRSIVVLRGVVEDTGTNRQKLVQTRWFTLPREEFCYGVYATCYGVRKSLRQKRLSNTEPAFTGLSIRGVAVVTKCTLFAGERPRSHSTYSQSLQNLCQFKTTFWARCRVGPSSEKCSLAFRIAAQAFRNKLGAEISKSLVL
jgi:hypothetical protein